MEKIIIVNKPKGKTSHDIVKLYRKKLGIKKIGHAGSLDPFATGVLILLVGSATKKFDQFKNCQKEYEMTIELGWQTDTDDITGKTTAQLDSEAIKKLNLSQKKIGSVLKTFQGKISQKVPKFSAVKFKGKPLYYYARKGIKVPQKTKKISITKITLLEYKNNRKFPQLKIKVICSSGTYMRQLAVDIGKKLNLPAVAITLKRTKIGSYTLAQCQKSV